MRTITHLALATLLALPLLAPQVIGTADAAPSGGFGLCFGLACNNQPPDLIDPQADRNGTIFDLGIDVSNVPLTPQGVRSFLATLSPQGQQIMMSTCQHYLGAPVTVRSPRTLEFCHVLLGA